MVTRVLLTGYSFGISRYIDKTLRHVCLRGAACTVDTVGNTFNNELLREMRTLINAFSGIHLVS